jgi:WD40 repeat protein/SAM-dependent methyltransferase
MVPEQTMHIESDWWRHFFDGLAVEFWLRMTPQAATQEEADFIERMLHAPKGAELLDVPCGGGRHAVALASRGYRMTGVDISPTFLRAAQTLARERDQTATWREQAMHEVSGPFDGAYCFGNSFGYYDDPGNLSFLRAVHRALRHGARFILDTSAIAECIFPTYQERAWMPVGDIFFLTERTYDPLTSHLETRYTFIRDSQVERRTAWLRVYTVRELLALMKTAGFLEIETYGTPAAGPFTWVPDGCCLLPPEAKIRRDTGGVTAYAASGVFSIEPAFRAIRARMIAHRLLLARAGRPALLIFLALWALGFILLPTNAGEDALPTNAIHRFGSMHFRPGGRIHTLIPMSEGKELITVSSGGLAVCLWNAGTGELLRSWSGEGIRGAALSTDESVLAIAQGHEIGLYDPHTGFLLRKLASKSIADITSVAFSGRNELVSADEQGLIQAWNCESGNQERSFSSGLEMPRFLMATPDGNRIAASSDRNGRVRIWDAMTGKVSSEFVASQATRSLAASPDGKVLLAAGAAGIQLRDMASGRAIRVFAGGLPVTQACSSPDGQKLAAIENDVDTQSLVIYDVGGAELRRIPCIKLDSVAFSKDGQTVFGGGWMVESWDVGSSKPCHKASGHSSAVAVLAVSPDGKQVASAGDDLCVWNVADQRLLFQGHDDQHAVDAVSFSATGREIVTRNAIYRFCRWHSDTGKLESRRNGVTGTYLPANDRLLVVAAAPPGIEIRNWQNEDVIKELELPGGPIAIGEIVESPDGRTYVGWTWTDQFFAWTASDGRLLNELGEALSPESRVPPPPRGMPQIAGPLGPVERRPRVAFSSDSRLIAVIRREDSLRIWELASRTERFKLNAHGPIAVAFSPDGRGLAVAGKDGAIRLWDRDSGSEVGMVQGQRGNVNCLAFSPNGKWLFSGADDTTVVAWDVSPFFKPSARMEQMSAAALDACWQDLQKTDAAEAFQSMRRLVAAGPAIIAALRRHLQPEAADQEQVSKLIRALDDDRYDSRQDATHALERIGERAGPALHKALGQPMSVEARSRAEAILARLGPGGGSALGATRAVEVLERLRAPEASALIRELAKGDLSSPVAQAAQAALHRLKPP